MRRTITALFVAAAFLGGCGGDDEDEPAATPTATAEETQAPAEDGGGGGEAVEVASPEDGGLSFEPAELTAPAGEVTFTYDNPSMVPHAFDIEDVEGGTTDTITQSDASVTVTLEAGEYTFYCPVGRDRGVAVEHQAQAQPGEVGHGRAGRRRRSE
jgi:plastocyanin